MWRPELRVRPEALTRQSRFQTPTQNLLRVNSHARFCVNPAVQFSNGLLSGSFWLFYGRRRQSS